MYVGTHARAHENPDRTSAEGIAGRQWICHRWRPCACGVAGVDAVRPLEGERLQQEEEEERLVNASVVFKRSIDMAGRGKRISLSRRASLKLCLPREATSQRRAGGMRRKARKHGDLKAGQSVNSGASLTARDATRAFCYSGGFSPVIVSVHARFPSRRSITRMRWLFVSAT